MTKHDANSLKAMLAHLDQMRSKVAKLLESQAVATTQEATPQNSQGGEDITMHMG
jgi:hypothetical protein